MKEKIKQNAALSIGAGSIVVLMVLAAVFFTQGSFQTSMHEYWMNQEECNYLGDSKYRCNGKSAIYGDEVAGANFGVEHTTVEQELNEVTAIKRALQDAGFKFVYRSQNEVRELKNPSAWEGTCKVKFSGDEDDDELASFTGVGEPVKGKLLGCKITKIKDVSCSGSGWDNQKCIKNKWYLEARDANWDIIFDVAANGDNDRLTNNKDECPEKTGLKEKNGCPNQKPVIKSIETPEKILINKTFQVSVNVRNPDSDDLKISWSNGDSGQTAEYVFRKNGSKQLKVAVSDGYDKVSMSKRVKVIGYELSLVDKIKLFFIEILP